jgi:hypothetical protein
VEDGETLLVNLGEQVLEIMIERQEEDGVGEEEMIGFQEEQKEDNLEPLGGDREESLEDLSLLDREDLSVNLVTLDNPEIQDRGDHLE